MAYEAMSKGFSISNTGDALTMSSVVYIDKFL